MCPSYERPAVKVSQHRDKPQHQRPASPARRKAAPADHYRHLHASFQWHVPTYFNMAQACCARWAELPNATENIAVYVYGTRARDISNSENSENSEKTGLTPPSAPPLTPPGASHTYAQLQRDANRLANVLKAQGVKRADRVAIIMPQRFETAVAYMAVLQMGAVAMPLSMLFGPEALEYRLNDSEAVLAICDAAAMDNLQSVRPQCPHLRVAIGVGPLDLIKAIKAIELIEPMEPIKPIVPGGATLAAVDARPAQTPAHPAQVSYAQALSRASDLFTPVNTLAEDPAILIYTSGTTGQPKGALLAHRALIGNLPGFVCSQNWFGFDGKTNVSAHDSANDSANRSAHTSANAAPNTSSSAVFWSPADWAWTGGLMDALLPTLYFGRPIVAFNGRFSPQTALELMRDCGVTHTFIFPTALKAMMKAFPGTSGRSGTAQATVRQQFKLKLQAIMSAGEAVGDAVFDYCEKQLGIKPNEMFGQTEINYIVGNCNKFWPSKPGSMGRAYPGHRVQVIDEEGHECPVGVPGDVAVNRFDVHGHPDPIFFLGYWKNAAATQAKYTGKNGPDDWCRTGDLATRDADGYLWFQGRSDDVFKAAGYRIGPGEVENCLVKHPAVANAAVVPKPDAARGAVVKAYVVLAPDFVTARALSKRARTVFDADLIAELQAHVKGKLAPYEYPKEIEFVDELPMTTSGKVQRRVLRLQEEARAKQAVRP